ncbi:MAG: capsule biosynthesis protein CapA [Pseudomonadota bacterium]
MAGTGETIRSFLLLQGPHGPFFWGLARHLRASGARVHRIGTTLGDRVFWPERSSYTAFQGAIDAWPAAIRQAVSTHDVTDVVLYGDTKPLQAAALAIARAAGLRIHVFEEGYLRPWWITYERDGANGHSPLMHLGTDDIAQALERGLPDHLEAPDHWGEMRQHIVYGALYHACVLAGGRRNARVAPHRGVSVTQEFRLYLRRLALMPAHRAARAAATRRIKRGGFPYHLVLLQLDHDASFRHHGPFPTSEAFLAHVINGFAEGAPAHHHLVMKAHPLEDGRVPQRRLIARLASAAGVSDRVHYVRGGKLAGLLDPARSAVTVNSTAAQQALWRGLPVRAFGAAVYAKPELTSNQPIAAFFANPTPPDRAAYATFRQFLLETSQVPGGFYSARGRRQVYRRVVDFMLADESRYARFFPPSAAPGQHLRLATSRSG